jgi:hypothetical protein
LRLSKDGRGLGGGLEKRRRVDHQRKNPASEEAGYSGTVKSH